MEYSLQMVFLCESGEKSSITISEVKPGLTNTDVIALMDTIIASNTAIKLPFLRIVIPALLPSLYHGKEKAESY